MDVLLWTAVDNCKRFGPADGMGQEDFQILSSVFMRDFNIRLQSFTQGCGFA